MCAALRPARTVYVSVKINNQRRRMCGLLRLHPIILYYIMCVRRYILYIDISSRAIYTMDIYRGTERERERENVARP